MKIDGLIVKLYQVRHFAQVFSLRKAPSNFGRTDNLCEDGGKRCSTPRSILPEMRIANLRHDNWRRPEGPRPTIRHCSSARSVCAEVAVMVSLSSALGHQGQLHSPNRKAICFQSKAEDLASTTNVRFWPSKGFTMSKRADANCPPRCRGKIAITLLHCMSPLLAQSGYAQVHCKCLLFDRDQ
jgi:hypothetical protein